MTQSDDSLTAQLTEARDNIRRELEILLSPSSIGDPPANADVIAALEAELREIQAALANRGA